MGCDRMWCGGGGGGVLWCVVAWCGLVWWGGEARLGGVVACLAPQIFYIPEMLFTTHCYLQLTPYHDTLLAVLAVLTCLAQRIRSTPGMMAPTRILVPVRGDGIWV